MTSFAAIAALAAALATSPVFAQEYPSKPIRLVTSESGGGNDVQARLVAQGLSMRLNQRVVVDNRPSGVIPGEIVSKASPDGYTLLLYNNALWTASLLQKIPYDPLRDLEPVALVSVTPNILVVNASVPANSVRELIALARAKPGELNYASSGNGGTNHLAAELFKTMAGVNIVRIAYKGAAMGLNDVVGGRIQVMFPTAPSAMPFIKSGKVRALAVTSAEPSVLAPGLPTVAAAGLPGFESIAVYGFFAPARTPRAITAKVHDEIVYILRDAGTRERFLNIGTEPVGGSPQQLAGMMKGELQKLSKLVSEKRIRE